MTALAGIAGPQGVHNPQDFGYDPNRQVQFNRPGQPAQQPMPQTGLSGFEDGVRRGLMGGVGVLEERTQKAADALMNSGRGAMRVDEGFSREAVNDINSGYASTAGALSGFAGGGAQAQNMQAALSGALGPIEQERAMANFSNSPGQQYLLDNSERALTRNAAATGGLGGGNILKALQGNAIGLAAQDFGNSFNRLGNVADRGLTAANALGGFQQNRAQGVSNLLSGLGNRASNTRQGIGQGVAGLYGNSGMAASGMIQNAGNLMGDARFKTGAAIADSIANTTNSVAEQQGGGILAEMLGGSSANLGNLIVQAQSGDANAKEQLAQLFANLAAQQGGSVAGLPGIPGVQETQGGFNRFMSSLPTPA